MSAIEEYKALPLGAGRSMSTIHGLKAVAECLEEIERLEAENERMDAFCKEFIWGEDNPHEYKTLFERAEQAEAELAALKEQAVRWEAMYEGQTAEKDGLEAELARTLVIMREGGCRDCDDLGEELAALKTENERQRVEWLKDFNRAEQAETKVEHLHEVLEQNAAELAKLKADVVYDDAGDHVQTWKTHAIVLDAENTQLKTYLERARTYKGVEAYACPLCTYKNGIFIEQCQMHKDIQDLEREWRQAKAECTQLYAIEHWARETVEGAIDDSSQSWMRLKDALDRWKEKHET